MFPVKKVKALHLTLFIWTMRETREINYWEKKKKKICWIAGLTQDFQLSLLLSELSWTCSDINWVCKVEFFQLLVCCGSDLCCMSNTPSLVLFILHSRPPSPRVIITRLNENEWEVIRSEEVCSDTQWHLSSFSSSPPPRAFVCHLCHYFSLFPGWSHWPSSLKLADIPRWLGSFAARSQFTAWTSPEVIFHQMRTFRNLL